jgi:RNA polymerase sigma-54 factor
MLKQNISLKLGQKLAPQQIQLMKLLQLHTLDFQEDLENELEENPALEVQEDNNTDEYEDYKSDQKPDEHEPEAYDDSQENQSIETDFNVEEYLYDDEPSYKTTQSNFSNDDEEYDNQNTLTQGQSLNDYLMEQIRMSKLSGEKLSIAEYIIGNIDEEGYLRRELKALVDDLAFSFGIYTDQETIEQILLNYVQKLDPVGVGARHLQECLLLQICAKDITVPAVQLAKDVLTRYFEPLANKQYAKILQRCACSEDRLKEAIELISNLNPRLGGNFETQSLQLNQEIIPDFLIQVKNNEVYALLNSKNAPTLKVSEDYKNILETYSHDKKSSEHRKAAMFIKQKLDAAKWYIDAVNQRQNTLIKTILAIITLQKEYFLTGEASSLKPMILKDVADITGFDISTISRVVKSKYAETPSGILYLKNLFSDSLKNDEGEDISTREIKQYLEEVIGKEDKQKPLTDDAVVDMLREKGYQIARRTIAKYREQLNIPVARLRKEL